MSVRSVQHIGQRLEQLVSGSPSIADAAEMLLLGEEILRHWVLVHGMEPTRDEREGFRLLALHRQGAEGQPSFNACRETCRELVYHYNLLTLQPGDEKAEKNAAMMALVANHLFLFVSGKMETEQLGDFCCASRPLRDPAPAAEAAG
jgi:hypothetical protein